MLRIHAHLLMTACLLFAGCSPAVTNAPIPSTQPNLPGIGPNEKIPARPAVSPEAGPEQAPPPLPRPATADNKPHGSQEYWEVHSLRGSRIGYAHYQIGPVTENDQPLIHTNSFSESAVERLGQTVRQQIALRSWDSAEGKLVRFETEVASGRELTKTQGSLSDDGRRLQLVIEAGGKKQQADLPWKPEWRGFFGAEQSLRAKPMIRGEQRTVVCLLPILNLPGETRLEFAGEEEVELPGGKQKLTKILAVTRIPAGSPQAQELAATIWVDATGEPLKSYIAGVGQETARATKELALAKPQKGDPRIDLIAESVVPVDPVLKNPLQTKRVVYKAHVKEGKIAGLFAECLSQRVKLIDPQTAEIEVRLITPDTKLAAPLPSPAPADSAANNLVQSDDPRVGRLALVPRRIDAEPWGLARELELLVNRSIRKKNFSQAFASAAEVARSLEGDCTEHSVLLAAVCRARKIPARSAIGLVYYPPKKGFAYHMWNEVWTGDRWLPLDATIGRGYVAADRLKLIDTNLDGANAYSAMLPVVQVFGRLELEILDVEELE